MRKAKIVEFKSSLTSIELFENLKNSENCEYPFFLDSGMDHEKLGRYSFMGINPFLTIKSRGKCLKVKEGNIEESFNGDIIEVLRGKLNQYKVEQDEIPFTGGAVGYLSYELAHQFESLPNTVEKDVDIPDLVMGFYDGIIIIDHLENKKYMACVGFKENIEEILKRLENIISKSKKIIKRKEVEEKDRTIKSNMTKEYYLDSIKKLKDYIYSGDIYQVNFTQRFTSSFKEDSFELYKNLKSINPAPFAVYFDFKEGEIISSSPERFIKLTNGVLEARPMKGTRPRGKTKEEDEKLKKELVTSEKDKAELLMIVDLMRNDISRVSKAGSVKVTELFHLEEYATVLQMVATVKGEIREDLSSVDVIKYTFPGGSITGAPKIRAMEIIDELETTTRNVYTGSIGYIGFNGNMDLNIAIRTIVSKDEKVHYQVGGGIVWDSDPSEEYEESLVKGRASKKALNIT